MDFIKIKAENQAINNYELKNQVLNLRSKPVNVYVELTGKCTLKCAHCGFHVKGRTSSAEIDDGAYQVIVKEFFPACKLCFLGGGNYGEVTIANKFHQAIKDCNHYNVGVNLTTNGTFISDIWVDDLVNVLDTVGFSMEGFGDEYEKIRGHKWVDFLKNVQKIINKREQIGVKFITEWRFCIHADNIHQTPELIKLAKEVGIDRIQIMPLVPYISSQKFKQIFYHRSLANKVFAEAREIANGLQFDINVPPDLNTGSFDIDQKTKLNIKPVEMKRCLRPWTNITINEFGVVKPCHRIWQEYGKIIGIKGGVTFWNNHKYKQLRRNVNSEPSPTCAGCRLSAYNDENSYANTILSPGRKDLLRKLFTIKKANKIAFVD